MGWHMDGTRENRSGIKSVKLLMDLRNQIANCLMVFSMIMCLMWILVMVCLSVSFHTIDQKGMLVFDAAQFDGILKKIIEFNNALQSDQEKQNLSLTELHVSILGAIVKILKDTSHYHSSKFADSDIDLLLNLLRSWPIAMIFPGRGKVMVLEQFALTTIDTVIAFYPITFHIMRN